MAYPEPIESLMDAFQRFPGIGRRTAERLAFHVLRDPSSAALARAIDRALGEAKRCRVCGNVAQQDPCNVCGDETRDASQVAVVEEPRHVEALERARVFQGLYHVLMGAWQPAEGTQETHLAIPQLIRRLKEGHVRELILATDPDAEGEATAQLVLEALDSAGIPDLKITRLARGLPAGAAIEYMHRGVIEDALEGRREVKIR
ncbi:MAG: recombination mediator RecR [Planctomycetota bacterium]|nr:recombination mediator RecR [Planctomycetota bacterium]